MSRRFALLFALAGLTVAPGGAQQPSPLTSLKTTAEASGFKSTSTYEDVVKFMKTVDDASPNVFYTTYGKTSEGRDMPMAVVGTGLRDATAATVKATGRLRVHIQGNIHAGEVEGKESAQILLRELGLGQHREWLQSMVLLITPIFNADGNERFSLTNRGTQNGPINGMGTRANGQSLNINRDFMKLDTPEGQAFVKLWNDYDPYVGFDLHTSDGSTHGYYLTYSPPLNPGTSDLIMNVMKNEWFPFVTKQIKTKHGWDTFYYGNVAGGGGRRGGGQPADAAGRAGGGGAAATAGTGQATGQAAGAARAQGPPTPEVVGAPPQAGVVRAWATFEHVPRFHNNYVGLRNRFALLSEAYAYATFEDRIKATNYFVEEALNFAHANVAKIKKTVADADKEALVGKSQPSRARIKSGGLIEILMGEVENEPNPNNGANMRRRKDVVKAEQMTDMLWFEATKTEDVPAEFYVPAAAAKAVALLQRHGVQMRHLTSPASGLEQFTITSNTARQPNGGIDTGQHGLRTLDGTWAPAAEATAAPGDWVVPMNQPLARLAFYLLAPTSDDGLTAWNYLDDMLGPDVKVYPILRKK